jgi:NADH:ubiquinone oxidoreductase subunit E
MNKHSGSDSFKPIRPGRGGKSKGRAFPKGRVLDPVAHDEVIAMLEPHRPLKRDMLIEYLHLIQDNHGCLSAGHLHGLAEEMRLPQAEVFEVATFYHHFDVVKEGEEKPAEITIRVCDSLSCEMAGAKDIIKALGDNAPENVRVVHGPCMGLCDVAPAAAVGQNYLGNVSVDKLQIMARNREIHPEMPAYQSLDEYKAEGGYEQLAALRGGSKSPDEVIQTFLDAGLKGLGGAGFPSGQKWKFVRAGEGPRYLCINGDEGEPGTFKDRYYVEHEPAPASRRDADCRPCDRRDSAPTSTCVMNTPPFWTCLLHRDRRSLKRQGLQSQELSLICGVALVPISAAKKAR